MIEAKLPREQWAYVLAALLKAPAPMELTAPIYQALKQQIERASNDRTTPDDRQPVV